jgi:hypothetical protein
LPGDLAEVAVFQGPRLQGDLYVGPAGKWNDTAIPRAQYMDQGNGGLWQMTDAEARGGIDGMHCWSGATHGSETLALLYVQTYIAAV